MVRCLRRKKYGGSVWNRMKEGAQGWKVLGNKSAENMKYAAEKAKQETQIGIDSYNRQKAINSFKPPVVGGKKKKSRKRKTRKRKTRKRKTRKNKRKSKRRR